MSDNLEALLRAEERERKQQATEEFADTQEGWLQKRLKCSRLYFVFSKGKKVKTIPPPSLSCKKLIVKRREEEIIYLFCPGGAAPDGFWFSDCCVCPEPVHVGC